MRMSGDFGRNLDFILTTNEHSFLIDLSLPLEDHEAVVHDHWRLAADGLFEDAQDLVADSNCVLLGEVFHCRNLIPHIAQHVLAINDWKRCILFPCKFHFPTTLCSSLRDYFIEVERRPICRHGKTQSLQCSTEEGDEIVGSFVAPDCNAKSCILGADLMDTPKHLFRIIRQHEHQIANNPIEQSIPVDGFFTVASL